MRAGCCDWYLPSRVYQTRWCLCVVVPQLDIKIHTFVFSLSFDLMSNWVALFLVVFFACEECDFDMAMKKFLLSTRNSGMPSPESRHA